MNQRLTDIAMLCIVVGVASACGSTPPSRFYTLSATTESDARPSTLSVAVGPVSVPGVVDRPEIVVSTGTNEVRLEEFNRWAAPLQEELPRVIAENLAAMLGTRHVTLFPQSLGADVEFRVTVEVQRFETEPGKGATLHAVWIVRCVHDGKTHTGLTIVRETVRDDRYDALAAAHSRAVARLSQDISDSIRALASL